MSTKKKSRAPTKFVRDPSSLPARVEGNPPDISHGRGNVIDIESAPRTPHEQSPFVIVFPAVMHNGNPFALDLQFLMPLRNVGEALRDGHLAHLGPRPNVNTAIAHTKSLRNGIVDFLLDKQLFDVEINTFCSSIPPLFETWLNQTNDEISRWSETTRATRYLYVKTIFEKLIVDSRWRALIPHRPRFKANPWPHRTHRAQKKEVIDDDLMTRIRIACIKEIAETVRRRSEFERILEEHAIESNPKKSDGLRVFARDRGYENIVISIYRELLKNPSLTHEFFPDNHPYILRKHNTTFSAIREQILPSPRPLVPFVLLMSLALAYNAGTARDVRLSDFRLVHEMSSYLVYFSSASSSSDDEVKPDLLVSAFKPRAGKRQPVYIPVDDEPDNPYFIFSFISEWTNEIRKFAYRGVADKLFIYCSTKSIHGISSFSGLDGTANPEGWNSALRKFREEHGLEYFTLEMIRPTALDATFEAFDGDIRFPAIQGNHAFVDTTSRSYESDAEKKRQYERLGTVHNRRDRWRKTDGTIDPRDHPEDFDLDCATPGWTCADPYDSPFTPKGELCRGYGRCPACPLGGVNLNSPLSCAYTLGLLEAIDNAQQSLDAMTWLQRWKPVRQRLVEKWIPSFSHHAMKAAREIDIPPMPRPE